MSELTTPRDLLIEELKDLYSAENQLIKALPKMAKAASTPELKEAFETHLEETKVHAQRLEKIMSELDESPGGKKNQLFRQKADGTFEDVSAGSGLDFAGHNMGVAIGDVNNDGLPDVLVTQYRGVKLFLNNGNGTFRDVTREAGLDNPSWATSAAFFDYDRDGWLDLVVVNYVDYDPTWPCMGAITNATTAPPGPSRAASAGCSATWASRAARGCASTTRPRPPA